MGTLSAHHLETILSQYREDNPEDFRLKNVMALAEKMAQSINEAVAQQDSEIYQEFRLISDSITKLKDDFSDVQTAGLSSEKIPSAERDLTEIVKSTEDATNRIMESAEQLMNEAQADDHNQENINQSAMEIFEACAFQDLTGQRVSRVIETLDFIDRRLLKLVDTFGDRQDGDGLMEDERAREKRKEDLMLHGPQDEDEAKNQDDIDALFQ